MSNIEKINRFLNREDLSETEAQLKGHLLTLDSKLKEASKAKEDLLLQLQNKEAEVAKLSGGIDALCSLILNITKEEEETSE
jgi:hypothetical protein